MRRDCAEQAIRLLRRAILLTHAGKLRHAEGQLAAARGNIINAAAEVRDRAA